MPRKQAVNDISPCPMCGYQPKPALDVLGWTIGHVCQSQLVGCVIAANYQTAEEAIAKWNAAVARKRAVIFATAALLDDNQEK